MNFHIHLPPPLWMVQVNLIVTLTSLFTSHTRFYWIQYGLWLKRKPNSYRIGVAILPTFSCYFHPLHLYLIWRKNLFVWYEFILRRVGLKALPWFFFARSFQRQTLEWSPQRKPCWFFYKTQPATKENAYNIYYINNE